MESAGDCEKNQNEASFQTNHCTGQRRGTDVEPGCLRGQRSVRTEEHGTDERQAGDHYGMELLQRRPAGNIQQAGG